MDCDKEPEISADSEPAGKPLRIIKIDELLGTDREVVLELDGTRYRLRITRKNKLILQK